MTGVLQAAAIVLSAKYLEFSVSGTGVDELLQHVAHASVQQHALTMGLSGIAALPTAYNHQQTKMLDEVQVFIQLQRSVDCSVTISPPLKPECCQFTVGCTVTVAWLTICCYTGS